LMEAAFAEAGLAVDAWIEPSPSPECRTADPVAWERLSAGPWFVLVALSARGGSPGSRPRG
jgi:hypothetical protein